MYRELSKLGYQGGGPTWEGIVFGLLKMRSPETLQRVTFDAEAEGLAIWSDDRSALERIGHLVGAAKLHPAVRDAAIEQAKKEGRIE